MLVTLKCIRQINSLYQPYEMRTIVQSQFNEKTTE